MLFRSNLTELIKIDKRWAIFVDEEGLFVYFEKAFESLRIEFIRTDDKGLKLEFPIPMGYGHFILSLQLKTVDIDLNEVILDQSKLIRRLKNNIETIAEYHKKSIHSLVTKAGDCTTYSASFANMSGLVLSQLDIKFKCQIKWTLHINGLYFNYPIHIAKFRLLLTNSTTNVETLLPSANGCIYQTTSPSTGNITWPFSFTDIAELDEGIYNVNIQWAYTSNNGSYLMYYYISYGDIRLIVETY